VLCDDGRLYHPVVADQARAAWDSKLQQRWRTECARIKKKNQRHETNDAQPTFEEWLAAGGIEHSPPIVPEPVPEDDAACPLGQRLQETETGTERLKEPPIPPAGGRELVTEFFAKAWKTYPEAGRGNHGPEAAWPEWEAAAARAGGEARLLAAVEARAAWLAKHPSERVKAFHRWLRDDGFVSYLSSATLAPAWSGPPEVWAAVVDAMGDAFAVSWLSDCAWQEAPVRALLSPSPTTIARLRQEVGPVLADQGVQILERAA
jgi:hypothetical protein